MELTSADVIHPRASETPSKHPRTMVASETQSHWVQSAML
jgi:hypothetical protein